MTDSVPAPIASADVAPADVAPAESLVPSPEADLPSAPPESATTPTTSAPTGPLPLPSVELLPIGEFDAPIAIATRPFDERIFVIEQGGRLIAVDDLSAVTVVDITDLTEASGERGLLGAAFHSDEDLAYLHYNDRDGHTVVDEYAVDPVTAVFDPASRREVLTVEQPFPNHNGGEIAFGPDGYLYIGLGDGGAADDPLRSALDLSSPLGKLLRIEPRAADGEPFRIPADNPFLDVPDADPRIWSIGLRNPWKFSFDPATGDLWIADVGQGDVEEIDVARADGGPAGRGLSFGWSAFEGTTRFNDDQPADGHTDPIVTYDHSDGDCSVSGGAVARSTPIPELNGWYVYGDFCSGRIWGYDTTSGPGAPVIVDLGLLPNVTAIAAGVDGELYAVSNAGTVNRFVAAG
ncbi:MAG: hypothetical protein HKN44_12435 [Ilumatobacter sp.]|nr:hypothetical protein [Ilumatobacter sp.]